MSELLPGIGQTHRRRWMGPVLDGAIVLLVLVFLGLPILSPAPGTGGSSNLLWLALPVWLAHHGIGLESATVNVTISALVLALAGAALSIVARLRANALLWTVGMLCFGLSIATLMQPWTAVFFVGALLLILALRARLVPLHPSTAVQAIVLELWPLGYAAGYAVLAWRYNPQLLWRVLLIALGAALVARAAVPTRSTQLT